MKKRVYSSIAVVITLALLFVLKIFVSDYFFDVLFATLSCLAAFEMSKMLTKMGRFNFVYVEILFPVLMFAANLLGAHFAALYGDFWWILYTFLIDVGLMIFVSACLFLYQLIFRKKTLNEIEVRDIKNISVVRFAFKKTINSLIGFAYPAFFFLFFVFLNHFNVLPLRKLDGLTSNFSVFILLTALLIPIFTDTFAMLTGSLIGGKKLCPKISPNKTIAGAVGGVVWCVLFSTCFYLICGCIESFEPLMKILPIWLYLIIVFIGSIVAQLGDIFESFIKRRAGVKDSGKFLPGQGGCMDRIDSHTLVAPYILIAFLIFAI